MSRVLWSTISTSLTVLFLFGLIIQFTLPAMSDGGVDFHADVTSGNAPLTVHFYDDTPGYKSSWKWNFGGEGGSTAKDTSYTFNSPGTYDISLTIYNGSEVPMGTEVKPGYITVYAPPPAQPVAEFLVNTTSGEAPLYVQFTGLASGGSISYDWDFGDGTQHSFEQSPLHVYSKPANYTARLKVSNPGGSNTKDVLISVLEPVVPANNSSQMVTETITPTPAPTVVPPTATPRSLIPSVSIPSISVSSDILQLVLAALAALVIAGAIIYYFTHLSKSDSNGEKPARNPMRKPRSPVRPRRAPEAKKSAKAPETPKQQPKPANPPAPVAKAPVKAAEAAKPQPKPAPVAQPPAKAPEAAKPQPGPENRPAPVAQPPAKEVPKQPAKAPEAPKPQSKPQSAPVPVAQPPAKAPEKPVAKAPEKAPEAPKAQPKPESTPAAQPPAKAPEKAPAPAPKPIKKDSEVDQDYIYDLVLGRDSETKKDGTKKN